MSDFRGRFLWYELMTTDPAAAKAFYTKLVGWGVQDWTGAQMPYAMWTRGEMPVGGVMELPAEARKMGAPPHWLPYLGVPSVDQSLKQAQGLGATLLAGPMDIAGVGRIAILKDPQGAVLAIYTPAEAPAPETEPGLGDFTWHELATSDAVAAWSFYEALFGWVKTEGMDMGPLGIYQMYGRPGGTTLGGIYKKPAEMPAPPHWLLYARVPDVNKAVDAIKAGGGQVINGPMEVPGGDWIVAGIDPQGAAFALHHKKA